MHILSILKIYTDARDLVLLIQNLWDPAEALVFVGAITPIWHLLPSFKGDPHEGINFIPSTRQAHGAYLMLLLTRVVQRYNYDSPIILHYGEKKFWK